MKTIQTTIAVLVLSIFIFSCSKEDEIPSATPKPLSEAVSFQNIYEIIIADASGANVDLPSTTISIINVNKIATILDYKKVTLEMNIFHTIQSELNFILVSPDGTECLFIKRVGSDGDFISTNKLRFSAAFTNILPNSGLNFVAGNYKESQGVGSFSTPILKPIFLDFQEKNIFGSWKLKITDYKNGVRGKIISWKLIFETGALNQ